MLIPATDHATFRTIFEMGMILHVVIAGLLLLCTRRFMRRAIQRDTPFEKTVHSSTIPVMIPVGDVTPHTEKSLRSLLEQDIDDYRVMLISATDDEPAANLIRQLCRDYGHASHIVAGMAQRCSQKNHNLLAAVASLHPAEEIMVFCDSTHEASPDFLARLIAPIIKGQTPLTSGYRFVRPDDNAMGTLFQMLAIQSLHMLYSIKPISQPWGGATAILRATFFDNRVPDLWSRTIVDDYSMGPYLQSLGIRSLPVAEACLETHLSDLTLSGASNWFYRQLQFFKFHTPLTWVFASIAPVFHLSMLGYIAATLIVPQTPDARALPLLYLGGMALLALPYTRIVPNTASIPKRIALYFTFTILASVQLLRTWTSNILSWQNIDYRVKIGGEITDITRHKVEYK